MSLQQTIDITCPFCDYQQSPIIWDTINCTADPKLKKNLLTQKINYLICGRCRKGIELAVDLLYHDMKNKFMVWLRYPDDHSKLRQTSPDIKIMQPLYYDYKFRLVISRNQLVEKIQIFDSNLDDRSIELTKIAMLSDWDYKDFPTEKQVIFQKLHKTLLGSSELLFWIVDPTFNGGKEIYTKYSFYSSINDKIQDYFSQEINCKPEWLQINREYAVMLSSDIHTEKSFKTKDYLQPSKPDGTVIWKDESGEVHEHLFQPNEIKEFLKESDAKQVYRILIKDPISTTIIEDYWQLTADQVKNFVDENSTAYCFVTYIENGERKQFLIIKDEWLKIPGYSI